MLAQNRNSGERLQRRHVAGASHHYVRLGVLVIACPLPDADAFCAMRGGGVHGQPLWGRMFACDSDVDVAYYTHIRSHLFLRRRVY
jgi:hypothetical protein